ncbi:hypothetical protein [Haloprofundus salilacus]|uniref:hypothetical protein n=1 Tax=Haloprofundus salilacus TaxID=2876190 RepID=UPI001CCE2A29|nr:hypothetical protein [Haloprofundus salilacus]
MTDSSRRLPTLRRAVALAALAFATAVYRYVIRPWHLSWGATTAERRAPLPGDELLDDVHAESTRAVTIAAPPSEVWPWLVQLGQGRAGFYSYDWLENLVGADIHNADRILPDEQRLAPADTVRLAPEDYFVRPPVTTLTVRELDAERILVLQGFDGGTWAFVLEPIAEGTTRLLVRSRAAPIRRRVGRLSHYLLYEPAHFLMERKMLFGIKARAERAYSSPPSDS